MRPPIRRYATMTIDIWEDADGKARLTWLVGSIEQSGIFPSASDAVMFIVCQLAEWVEEKNKPRAWVQGNIVRQ